jgi:hypothetical protein
MLSTDYSTSTYPHILHTMTHSNALETHRVGPGGKVGIPAFATYFLSDVYTHNI